MTRQMICWFPVGFGVFIPLLRRASSEQMVRYLSTHVATINSPPITLQCDLVQSETHPTRTKNTAMNTIDRNCNVILTLPNYMWTELFEKDNHKYCGSIINLEWCTSLTEQTKEHISEIEILNIIWPIFQRYIIALQSHW